MKKLLLVFFTAILAFSCDHSKLPTKPAHSGSAGEIIVVASNSLWDSGLDSVIQDVFQYYVPMLPQPEAAFSILHYTPDQFSMILERHRNIISVKINPNLPLSESKFDLLKDKWAQEQLVLEVEAQTMEKIKELFLSKGKDVVRIINQKEDKRLSKLFSAYPAKASMEFVKNKFDIDLIYPQGFELAKDSSDFLWLKREKSRNLSGNVYYIIQNLVIYTSPYDSDSAFSDANLLRIRDSFVKSIPGPSEGSYMTTVYAFQDMNLYPEGEDVEIDGRYGRLIRGLWKMENDFMGGPFISLSAYDEKNNRIITVEGEVFAPKFDKREYLRELEAVLFSMHFNNQDQ